ncbi:C40 family peptidase [Natronospora cellulosivora (SeqCode)]
MKFNDFLNDNMEAIEKKVLEVKDSLIGIPYLHNGRSYEGVDCLGLIYLFFKELGVEFPIDDGRYIPDDWYKTEPDRYINGLREFGEEVGHYEELRIFDLPYFSLYKNIVTHSGVMIDNKNFLHVLNNKRVTVASFERRFWRAKYVGGRRVF